MFEEHWLALLVGNEVYHHRGYSRSTHLVWIYGWSGDCGQRQESIQTEIFEDDSRLLRHGTQVIHHLLDDVIVLCSKTHPDD